MKHFILPLLASTLLLTAADAPQTSPERTPQTDGAGKPTTPPRKPFAYRPPANVGAPKVRMDGGSRGGDTSLPQLYVIAPDHAGFTTQAQPTLTWFLSQPTKAPVVITVISNDAEFPMLEVNTDGKAQGQFHQLKLADHKIELAPGAEYEWSASIVPDPDKFSQGILASGRIRRVAPTVEQTGLFKSTPAADLPLVYAQQGFWYDAIATLQSQLKEHPDNAVLLDLRNNLLSQVGLTNCLTPLPAR